MIDLAHDALNVQSPSFPMGTSDRHPCGCIRRQSGCMCWHVVTVCMHTLGMLVKQQAILHPAEA